MKMTYKEIAEKCLTRYWGKPCTIPGLMFERGWDRYSPAHKFALRWAERNYSEFKKLDFKSIYKMYLLTLVEE